MMGGTLNEIFRDITTVALAIVGVAILALLVSRRSQTPAVINASSSAFNTGLATAEGPVTGYTPGPPIYASGFGNLSFPDLGGGAGFLTAGG
jgi:hypothetical protein